MQHDIEKVRTKPRSEKKRNPVDIWEERPSFPKMLLVTKLGHFTRWGAKRVWEIVRDIFFSTRNNDCRRQGVML